MAETADAAVQVDKGPAGVMVERADMFPSMSAMWICISSSPHSGTYRADVEEDLVATEAPVVEVQAGLGAIASAGIF